MIRMFDIPWSIIVVQIIPENEMPPKKEAYNIIESYKLLHKIGRPLGLSCYTLPSEHEKQEVRVTTLNIVRLIMMFTTHAYLTYYNFRYWETVSMLYKTDTLFNTGIKLITTGSLLLTNISMIVVFLMRKRFWGIFVAQYDIVTEVDFD